MAGKRCWEVQEEEVDGVDKQSTLQGPDADIFDADQLDATVALVASSFERPVSTGTRLDPLAFRLQQTASSSACVVAAPTSAQPADTLSHCAVPAAAGVVPPDLAARPHGSLIMSPDTTLNRGTQYRGRLIYQL